MGQRHSSKSNSKKRKSSNVNSGPPPIRVRSANGTGVDHRNLPVPNSNHLQSRPVIATSNHQKSNGATSIQQRSNASIYIQQQSKGSTSNQQHPGGIASNKQQSGGSTSNQKSNDVASNKHSNGVASNEQQSVGAISNEQQSGVTTYKQKQPIPRQQFKGTISNQRQTSGPTSGKQRSRGNTNIGLRQQITGETPNQQRSSLLSNKFQHPRSAPPQQQRKLVPQTKCNQMQNSMLPPSNQEQARGIARSNEEPVVVCLKQNPSTPIRATNCNRNLAENKHICVRRHSRDSRATDSESVITESRELEQLGLTQVEENIILQFEVYCGCMRIHLMEWIDLEFLITQFSEIEGFSTDKDDICRAVRKDSLKRFEVNAECNAIRKMHSTQAVNAYGDTGLDIAGSQCNVKKHTSIQKLSTSKNGTAGQTNRPRYAAGNNQQQIGICSFYKRGHCKFGSRCWDRHEDDSVSGAKLKGRLEKHTVFSYHHVGGLKLFDAGSEGDNWIHRQNQTHTADYYVETDVQPVAKGNEVMQSADKPCKFGQDANVGVTCVVGSIDSQRADLLITPANDSFDLRKHGVTNVLLSKAGPALQKDCDRVDVVISDTAFCDTKMKHVTCNTSKLLYQDIVYAALPGIKQKREGYSDYQAVKQVLSYTMEYAEKRGYKEILLPPILFPFTAFCSCLCDYLNSNTHQSVNRIVINVLKESQAKTIHEALEKKCRSVSLTDNSAHSSEAARARVIDITAQTVDITKVKSDVIITSKGVVRQIVLDAAGYSPCSEFDSIVAGGFKSDSIIVTTGGHLKCTLYHLNCDDYDGLGENGQTAQSMRGVIRQCLERAHARLEHSIAMPAIGTGKLGYPVELVADIIVSEVDAYQGRHRGEEQVTSITICSIDEEITNGIQNVINTRRDRKPAAVSEVDMSPKSLLSSDCVVYRVNFTIWSLSKEAAVKAKKDIKEYCRTRLSKVTESYSHIVGENGDDLPCEDLLTMGKVLRCNVKVSIDVKKKCVTLEGHKDDVDKASVRLHKLYLKLHQAYSLAENKVQWKYRDVVVTSGGPTWKAFSIWDNYLLEQAYEIQQREVDITDKASNIKSVNLRTMKAVDINKRETVVERSDQNNICVPSSWSAMSKAWELVALPTNSEEYKRVKSQFAESAHGNSVRVIRIERVQNTKIYKQYKLQLEDARVRCAANGHAGEVERWLYHGTHGDERICSINEHGFDRGFAGRNATLYGQGTYFAVSATYSLRYTSSNRAKERHLYLCQVVTGEYCVGDRDMKVPIAAAGSTPQQRRYDATVDNMSKPTIFVVYNDNAAYPHYLITFTTT